MHNAQIYLFDDADSTKDAILIKGGRIAAVGTKEALQIRAGTAVQIWNIRGATMLPGLIDTHPHLLHFAARQAPPGGHHERSVPRRHRATDRGAGTEHPRR